MKIGQKLMNMQKKMDDCPVAQRMKKQIIRLLKLVEKAKKVTDEPT